MKARMDSSSSASRMRRTGTREGLAVMDGSAVLRGSAIGQRACPRRRCQIRSAPLLKGVVAALAGKSGANLVNAQFAEALLLDGGLGPVAGGVQSCSRPSP